MEDPNKPNNVLVSINPANPPLVVQPTNRPTNKIVASVGAGIVVTPLIQPWIQEVWPNLVGAPWNGPATVALIGALLTGIAQVAVGWLVRDRAAIPVPGTEM